MVGLRPNRWYPWGSTPGSSTLAQGLLPDYPASRGDHASDYAKTTARLNLHPGWLSGRSVAPRWRTPGIAERPAGGSRESLQGWRSSGSRAADLPGLSPRRNRPMRTGSLPVAGTPRVRGPFHEHRYPVGSTASSGALGGNSLRAERADRYFPLPAECYPVTFAARSKAPLDRSVEHPGCAS